MTCGSELLKQIELQPGQQISCLCAGRQHIGLSLWGSSGFSLRSAESLDSVLEKELP